MRFFLKIVFSTPLFKTIIIMQLLASLLTFVGIPLLIPLIESAQNDLNNIEITNQTLNLIVNTIGLDKSFRNLLFMVFTIFIFSEGIKMLSNLIAQNARLELVVNRRDAILSNYLHTDWLFLNTDKSGDMNDSIIRQADLSGFVHLNAIRLISWFIQFATYLALALFISVDATLAALVVYLLISILNFINSIGFKKTSDLFHNLTLRISTLISDFQRNRKQYKATSEFSLYQPIDITIRDAAKKYFHLTIREELQGYWIHILSFGFLVSLLAFYETFNLNFSQLIVLVLVFQRLTPAYQGTQKGYLDYRKDIPAYNLMMNRIEKISQNIEKNGDIEVNPFSEIFFKNVGFYFDSDTHVLKDLSFSIKPKETLIIIGESGSGKSTILDLVTGLLRPTSGEIYFNNSDSIKVNFKKYRQNISYVGQEVTILDGTVLDNVLLGIKDEDVSDLKPQAANVLSLVHLDKFVEDNKDGLHYEVGENGSNLSGGQVQRLLLARALYRNPSLLILDEATSSLDAKTDKHINETLNNIKGTTTIVLVTHKLNNLSLADKIIFLKDGRIAEIGNFQDLIDAKGDFSVFYNSQKPIEQ